MTNELTATEGKLDTRFRSLMQRLNGEFGFQDQRLTFTKRSHRFGYTNWELRRPPTKCGVPPPGDAFAVSMEVGGQLVLRLAYDERWANTGPRKQLRFESSNFQFVVPSADAGVDVPNVLQFRLEWSGRQKQNSGEFQFPGVGSAHPHWHIDVSELGRDDAEKNEIEIQLPSSTPSESIDLVQATKPDQTALAPTGSQHWFRRLHLPARAMWHETPCLMPDEVVSQQHQPASVEEIDNWVISSVRYVCHEFSIYSGHKRRGQVRYQ